MIPTLGSCLSGLLQQQQKTSPLCFFCPVFHCNHHRRPLTCHVCTVGVILVVLAPACFTRLLSKIGFPFLRPCYSYVHSPVFSPHFDHCILLPSGFGMIGPLFCLTGCSARGQKGASSPHQGGGAITLFNPAPPSRGGGVGGNNGLFWVRGREGGGGFFPNPKPFASLLMLGVVFCCLLHLVAKVVPTQ